MRLPLALLLDDASGLAPVETAVGSTWVRAVGVGAGIGHESKLPAAGSVLGTGSPGCSHPCLLGLPPGPQLALDAVAPGSVVEAAVDGEGLRSVPDGVPPPGIPPDRSYGDGGRGRDPEAGWCRLSLVTASGATAVQIAEYVDGRRRIVVHVGSAHTEAELGLLVERARELLEDLGQGEFDLGLEPAAPRTTLIGRPRVAALFDEAGSAARERRPVPAPRVVGTSSRVLYDALCAVFTNLGLDTVGDAVFRDLVIARIVEPTSILDTGRVLSDLGVKPASEKTMRRALARAAAEAPTDDLFDILVDHGKQQRAATERLAGFFAGYDAARAADGAAADVGPAQRRAPESLSPLERVKAQTQRRDAHPPAPAPEGEPPLTRDGREGRGVEL